MVMCDETTDTGVKVLSLDKSDPFVLDIQVESIFRSASLAPNMASIAHNPYVMGDSANPFRRGFYDTTPGQNTYGGGVWGAYPWLPSGNILGSDISNGLFVVRLEEMQTLPVTYTDWSAATDGKNALLNWSAATEESNEGWTVEHATGAGNWAGVGWVAAATGRYAFVHPDPGPGRHFYRLRQRDLDGSESVSDLRSVSFDGAARESIALFPNPAPAAAPVALSAPSGTAWELCTLRGQTLRRGTGNIPTEGLAAGVYLVRAHGKAARLIVQ